MLLQWLEPLSNKLSQVGVAVSAAADGAYLSHLLINNATRFTMNNKHHKISKSLLPFLAYGTNGACHLSIRFEACTDRQLIQEHLWHIWKTE